MRERGTTNLKSLVLSQREANMISKFMPFFRTTIEKSIPSLLRHIQPSRRVHSSAFVASGGCLMRMHLDALQRPAETRRNHERDRLHSAVGSAPGVCRGHSPVSLT